MWFFMYACYLLSLATFGLLVTGFFQNVFHFDVFRANPVTFMILTSIVYLFTETLVIFFFVGIGVSIRDYTQEHGLNPDFHRRSIGIKRVVYPPQLLNMVLMIVLFIGIGAVDTGHCPAWLYGVYYAACLGHFMYAKIIQHRCFRDSTETVLAMAGIARTA
ncbi:MAG: hypothetical protein Q8Q08_09185 [Candidatus Omnitrophota bacterium]|nr:hypothetical protein [Candidatus Omnitrophota bacterium]MDZ4242697.1 hypothetical protein [Candidatus Omnitrophota bacterium]